MNASNSFIKNSTAKLESDLPCDPAENRNQLIKCIHVYCSVTISKKQKKTKHTSKDEWIN